jgi:hypothetical protein
MQGQKSPQESHVTRPGFLLIKYFGGVDAGGVSPSRDLPGGQTRSETKNGVGVRGIHI